MTNRLRASSTWARGAGPTCSKMFQAPLVPAVLALQFFVDG